MWRIDPWQLSIAMFFDLLLGDPRGLPHLARLTGMLALRLEPEVALRWGRTVLAGVVFWVSVCGLLVGALGVIWLVLHAILHALSWWLGIVVIYQSIAARDLYSHVREVIRPLKDGDLRLAREKLAMIVGRDTQNLDADGIHRAGIESVAESLTDGIVAPLFWAVIAGAPGALLYRVANTLDSIVGHRNAKYEEFGKISARIDDLLSWIPARITALLFWAWRPSLSLQLVQVEASKHASPNAGWAESAMANVLRVRLGGDNYYQGELVQGPSFCPSGRVAVLEDLERSLVWLWKITGLCFILCLLGLCLRRCLL